MIPQCGLLYSRNPSVTLSTMMSNIIRKADFTPTEGIIQHEEGIDLLPSNQTLAGMEIALAQQIRRETVLRKYIDKVKPLYDYIIVDCSPSLDMLTINALAAADNVLIPVTPKYLDAKGLEQLLKTVFMLREEVNSSLSISGILLTMVDRRLNFTKKVIDEIEVAYGGNIQIFKHHVPLSVRAAEVSSTGRSIYEYDPRGKVTKAYESLTADFLDIEDKDKTFGERGDGDSRV